MKTKAIRYNFTPTRMTIIKMTDYNNIVEDMEELESSNITEEI